MALSLIGQETAQEHVRTGLMLLDDVERELLALGLPTLRLLQEGEPPVRRRT